MHTRARITENWLRHECRRFVVTERHVLHDVLVHHHAVCHLNQGTKFQIDLGLTCGSNFMVLTLDL